MDADPKSKHEQRLLKHQSNSNEQQEKPKKKKPIALFIALILVIGISYLVYSYNTSPGKYDSFAKCLADKSVMYGAIEWCQYTKQQANMFGKSFKYINYKNFQQGPSIKITPTWIINDQRYEGVQSFEKLSTLTGCGI